VKRPRSLKKFTLTTARARAVVSEIAAMNTPQRRQIRKSQVRVPKRFPKTVATRYRHAG
jgi:hypothetical protein